MTVFTTEELNLICIYAPGNRKGTIKELKNMIRYLMPDETDLHDLADGVIHKLKDMSDEEYDELSDSLTPDCSFDCEDSAYDLYRGLLFSVIYERIISSGKDDSDESSDSLAHKSDRGYHADGCQPRKPYTSSGGGVKYRIDGN